MAAGYQTIGGMGHTTYATEERNIAGGGYQSSASIPVKDEEVATGSGLPSLYTAPFDLSTGTSIGDRLKLIWESARPWGEFFDFNTFSIPKRPTEIKERLMHNSEVFLSNYVIAAACYMVFFFFIHPLGTVSLLGVLFLLSWFYGTRASEIHVTDTFVISGSLKHIIMGVAVALAVFVFHGFGALLGLVWFCVIFVGIHLLLVTPSRTEI